MSRRSLRKLGRIDQEKSYSAGGPAVYGVAVGYPGDATLYFLADPRRDLIRIRVLNCNRCAVYLISASRIACEDRGNDPRRVYCPRYQSWLVQYGQREAASSIVILQN